MKINYSSELMTNQKHATVMAPQGQFRVLQTQQSHMLAFSIGTDNILYRTLEQPGSRAGWSKVNESSSLSGLFNEAAIDAKLFDVSQNFFEGSFDIAMAVTIAGVDHLVLSLGNANLDTSWDTPLIWASIPFDDPTHSAEQLTITGIYLLQDSAKSYIVVDTLKDPASPLRLIERFFIDPSKLLSGRYWNRHELSISLEDGNVSSMLGRKAGQMVGGIYTMGTLTSSVELVYSQIYNPFNPIHGNPLVSRFVLPEGTKGPESAFALGRNADGTTDVYVVAAGGLYYLAASDQKDLSVMKLLVHHSLLEGATSLGVDANGTEIVVWGLNKFGRVFCLRNQVGHQQSAGDWSVPVPILANGLKLSSLINRSLGGSVIFVHTADDDLIRLSESLVTRLWSMRTIVLPPTDPKDMLTVKTYTTHVQLSGDDNLPLKEQAVAMSATSPCSVYINSQYINLFTDTLVDVKTDARGTLTILQEVKGLGAISYRIDAGGSSVPINPMAKVMEKLATVKDGASLDLMVTNSRGQKIPLVGSGISKAQKTDTAEGIKQFVRVSNTLPPDGSTSGVTREMVARTRAFDPARDRIFGFTFAGTPTAYFDTVAGAQAAGVTFARTGTSLNSDGIWATAGDIFEWIEHAIEEVEEFFVQVIDEIATCFVRIAGALYRFVLDCIQSVASGINFLLAKIKLAIDDLIMWLGFLFEWPDIVRTHRVLRNVFKQFAGYSIGQLDPFKEEIVKLFGTIESEMKKWADLPNMPASASSLAGSQGIPPSSNDPQVHWGTYQITDNVSSGQTSYTQSVPQTSELEKLLNELVAALQHEEEIFENAITLLQTEVIAQFNTLSVTDLLKKVIVIVLDVLLETVENVLVTVIDIVKILVEGVLAFLDAPIDIPIISQIYREATEGDTLTILDAICLVIAIPATILYKIAEEKVPFPDNAFTNSLIHAPDFKGIQALYSPSIRMAEDDNQLTTLEKVCFYSAATAALVLTLVVPLRSTFGDNVPIAVVGTVTYLFYCAPNLPGIVENKRGKWYNIVNDIITTISIIKAFGDISLTSWKEQDKTDGTLLNGWKKVSPYVEVAINVFWFIPVIGTIVEEGGVMACIANSGFNIAGMMALPLSQEENPEAYAAGMVGFFIGNTVYGFLDVLLAQDANVAAGKMISGDLAIV